MTDRLPTPDTRWRCSACGNLTRFDVVRSSRVREFWHLDLAGEPAVEESEALSETVDDVRCRWCGASGTVELVPRPAAGGPAVDPTRAQGSAV
ncbi:MAG: hypothetical protein WAN48_10435 [Actinomycetes bacterium]